MMMIIITIIIIIIIKIIIIIIIINWLDWIIRLPWTDQLYFLRVIRKYSFSTYANHFQKTNISDPLIRFSENFASILNEWFLHREKHISTFSGLYLVFMCFWETRNKLFWFYTKFWVKRAVCLAFTCTSLLLRIFFERF